MADLTLNRPSLRAIDYRIGTYATFRRSMLEQIARWGRTAPSTVVPPTVVTTSPTRIPARVAAEPGST